MDKKIKKKLRTTIIIFWLLLVYVVAALVWWFISLEKQNDLMLEYKLHQTEIQIKVNNNLAVYNMDRHKAIDEYRRNKVKYAGEGIVFFGLILLCAFYIFRSIRQQMRMQQQQQNFMMAVTHELKTPIAIAKLNLETLLKHRLDAQKQFKLLKTTLDETKRLDFLTNNILISAQLENSNKTLNKEYVDFSGLLHNVVADFRSRYPDRIFKEDIQNEADVNGDPLLLQILISNLMENAIKYSDKNTPVSITLKKQSGELAMQITDEGVGVPDIEKKKIFQKFYRIGNEQTRKKQGTGLGLYLCDRIATHHNADITIANNIPVGSIFAVHFKA